MSPEKIIFSVANRPWARSREYQRFWGTYVRCPVSGLYFAENSDPSSIESVNQAFSRLPQQLQSLARQWQVTFSFTSGRTAAGNSATFYADFSQRDRHLVSPHIELSLSSLSPPIIVAHLCHELSHLYWRTSPRQAQQSYRDFLQTNSDSLLVEVTPYAQRLFQEYLKEEELRRNRPPELDPPWLKEQDPYHLKSWTEESFCETVAVLACPDHPDFQVGAAEELETRRGMIACLMGLHIDSASPVGC